MKHVIEEKMQWAILHFTHLLLHMLSTNQVGSGEKMAAANISVTRKRSECGQSLLQVLEQINNFKMTWGQQSYDPDKNTELGGNDKYSKYVWVLTGKVESGDS